MADVIETADAGPWIAFEERMMSERVVCTIDSGVADVRLNRPDKLNA